MSAIPSCPLPTGACWRSRTCCSIAFKGLGVPIARRFACGGGRGSAIRSIVELLVWVMCVAMPRKPSFPRWTSSGSVVALYALGVRIHSVFVGTWLLAFGGEKPNHDGGDAGDFDVASFSATMGRRLASASVFAGQDDDCIAAVIIALASELVGVLALQVLHVLDTEGLVLKDIVCRKTSPTRFILRRLCGFLTGAAPYLTMMPP